MSALRIENLFAGYGASTVLHGVSLEVAEGESIAVVGRRDQIADLVRAKVGDLADAVSLECTRRPDPWHFGDIGRALRTDG